MINLRNDINLKQNLNLSPKVLNYLKVIQMNNLELKKYIELETESNPLIDLNKLSSEDWSKYFRGMNEQVYRNKSVPDSINYENFLKKEDTLESYLLSELRFRVLDSDVREVIEVLIYSLDDNGFLPYSSKEILSFFDKDIKIEIIESAIKCLKTFDPPGIGASDLRESLLIQAKDDLKLKELIEKHYEKLLEMDVHNIMNSMNLTRDDFDSLLFRLKNLNPCPSSGFLKSNDIPTEYIVADIIMKIDGDCISLSLDESSYPKIYISPTYLKMLESETGEVKDYLTEKLNYSKMLIENIEKRKTTIMKVAKSIFKYQKNYFLKDEELMPMNMELIAKDTDFSVSTISRAIKNKYISTPKGLFELNYFFSNKKYNDNLDSVLGIKNMIKEIIENENKEKPLSDNKICQKLNNLNVDIARRTVSKYREELDIPSAQKRKKLYKLI
ncbi:MAG: RNA polymerase factor sigma-54 [Andreesenia angusta]|nr:RNA polymerase factor sigma-54 [Andreesenia angusta]